MPRSGIRHQHKSEQSNVLRALALTATLLSTTYFAGCSAIDKTPSNSPLRPEISQLKPGTPELKRALGHWQSTYAKDNRNLGAALNFAAALRLNEQGEQAEAVLRRTMIVHQGNPNVAAAYGKVLAENGKLQEALGVIDTAMDPARPDWKMQSARAAILDQMGRKEEARRLYQLALKAAPGEPSILNNLGMSYLLSGELEQAETSLRLALQSPKAGSRVRQNLALTLGLQGKYQEAIRVAQAELDPNQAQANVEYLRQMLAQS